MTVPREAEKIEVGTQRMRKAWEQGLGWYQPTLCSRNKRGPLVLAELQEEGGVTRISTENLEILVDHFGDVQWVRVGPNQGVLVCWDQHVSYLATGFSIGYMGEGPTGFAKFLADQDFGDYSELRSKISMLSENWTGVLAERSGRE